MLRIGIIGVGGMGRVHASIYRGIKNVELRGIFDIREEAAQSLAGDHNATVFKSADELITSGGCDIIDVCVPTPFHKEYTIKAATAGRHVICEKPIARTLEDALEMVKVADKSGVKFMVAQVARFFPEYVKIKNLLEDGLIGKPAVVRASRSVGGGSGWNNWYSDYEMSGGLMLELMIHDFDILRWYFGRAKRVFASEVRRNGAEYALATLKFENGVIAHVEGSRADFFGFKTTFEAAGDKGLLDFDSVCASPISVCLRKSQGVEAKAAIPLSPAKESPFYKELVSFVECVERNSEPPIGGADASESLRIALAALESSKTGRVVNIS